MRIEINSVEDMFLWKGMLDLLKTDAKCLEDTKHVDVILMRDLDFRNKEWGWDYFGSYYGTFDGNGHTIKNVRIVVPETKHIITRYYTGFFSNLHGTVRNFNLNCTIPAGKYYTGGICGNNFGTIENCSVSGFLRSEGLCAGIAGFNNGTISNCETTATIRTTCFDFCTVRDNGFRLDPIVGDNDGELINPIRKGSISFTFAKTSFPERYLIQNEGPTLFKDSEFIELLKSDNSGYKADSGRSYLHLACMMYGIKGNPKHILERIIAALCTNTEIDFAARDNVDKEAADYLKNSNGHAFRGCKTALSMIETHKKEQAMQMENDTTFSDIGF